MNRYFWDSNILRLFSDNPDHPVLRSHTERVSWDSRRRIGLMRPARFPKPRRNSYRKRDSCKINFALRTDLDRLPEALRQAVLAVTTTPPVSDFLDITLSLSPRVPPLPCPDRVDDSVQDRV